MFTRTPNTRVQYDVLAMMRSPKAYLECVCGLVALAGRRYTYVGRKDHKVRVFVRRATRAALETLRRRGARALRGARAAPPCLLIMGILV